MGVLVDGVWRQDWVDGTSGERFVRKAAAFRNWVTADGTPGPSGAGGFRAEPGRYHLYVSPACPWSQRAMIYRALKRLEDIVSMSIVDYYMGADGWTFTGADGSADPVNGASRLWQLYVLADPDYSGRATVPVLWDRQTRGIVSNESSEIIRMFETAFDAFTEARIDARPEALREEIGALNQRIYDTVNNGVYRAGFAGSQAAYEEAVRPLFGTLDGLEARLADRRFLCGDGPTEADWRLLPTLLRFDAVYFIHFKCSLRRLADYPNLSGYTRDLYQWPGVAGTFFLEGTKAHYYRSHGSINPRGVVPAGPEVDFSAPHGRERVGRRPAGPGGVPLPGLPA
jgi:putative glutathione S-transferase